MEKKLSDINLFVCSTYIDLRNYRDEVIKKIQSQAGLINAQEFFGARDNKPIETCLREVELSNVFVMFLAFRLGSIDAESGKYFVEKEYEKAKQLGLPKFIYFLDDESPFPPKFVATGKEAEDLKKFKDKLRKDHTIETFTTTEDLANKISQNLLKELPKKGFKIGSVKKDEIETNAIAIIKKFMTLPKIFYGREVELSVTLGDYDRAPENECDAYSLRYGATAKREFKISDPKIAKEISGFYYIYADGGKAEELISLPKAEIITVLLKTIQGTLYWDEPIYEIQDVSDLVDVNSIYTVPVYSAFSVSGRQKKTKVQTGSTKHSNLACGLEFISAK